MEVALTLVHPPLLAGAMVGRDFPGQGSSSQQIRLAAAAAAAQAAAADKGGRGGRGRGGRKRKERDANRAPRQPSAYNLFMKDELQRVNAIETAKNEEQTPTYASLMFLLCSAYPKAPR